MGNRAIITIEDGHGVQHPVALYVHWHGGLESVLAFMEYTWQTFERGRGDVFTFHARLCQVIGNFFADGLSMYGHPLAEADEVGAGCDNGRFHWRVDGNGVTLIDRVAETDLARGHEYWTREHPLHEIIKQAMPTRNERFVSIGGVAPVGVEAVS